MASGERDVVAHALQLLALFVTLFAPAAHAAHFDEHYKVKYGDANSDGLTDLYLEYWPNIVPIPFDDLMIPVPISKREVGEFVLLQQANGTFAAATPSSAQQVAFKNWHTAALKLLLSDIDLDNNIDVLITKVSSIAPAAKDIIVYAPATQGEQPAVKPLDSNLVKFMRDLDGWASNPQAYYANAFVERTITTTVPVPRYDCGGLSVGFASPGVCVTDLGYGSPCLLVGVYPVNVPITIREFDTTNYSSAAKAIADALAPFSDATTPVSDAAMQTVVLQASQVLDGRPFFPDAAPGTVEWEELRKWLKDIVRGLPMAVARASILIGGTLYPSQTADSDLSDEWTTQSAVDAAGTTDAASKGDGYLYFYHTTLASNVSSILGGVAEPRKRNFQDELGFYLATNRQWAFRFGQTVFGKFKPWVTIEFRMTMTAHQTLIAGGARYRFHTQAPGLGTLTTFELIVPPHLYGTFNSLMASGQIVPTPLPVFRF